MDLNFSVTLFGNYGNSSVPGFVIFTRFLILQSLGFKHFTGSFSKYRQSLVKTLFKLQVNNFSLSTS